MFRRLQFRTVQKCACNILRRKFNSEGEELATKTRKSYPVLTGERGINHVTLIGRVGRDPEVRGSSENPVVMFPLATSQSFRTTDGSYQQYTDWHRIAIFRHALGQIIADRVGKGDRVYVSGRISYSRYEDEKTHTMATATQIKAEDVILLSSKSANSDGAPIHDDLPEDDTKE